MAIYLVSANVSFLATEFGDKAPGYAYLKVGWEFPFAMLMQALALVLVGAGAWSVDYCIWGRKRAAQPATAAAPPPAVEQPTAPAPVSATPK